MDGWAEYNGLIELGFKHFAFNHSEMFACQYVNYNTGELVTVHTNTIEGAWKHAKVSRLILFCICIIVICL